MTKITELLGTCASGLSSRQLEEVEEHDREITSETFFRHVDRRTVSELLNYQFGRGPRLHLRDDYSLRYYRSKVNGKPCYHLDWSRIDHIFQ
jgi:hypothetical protein